MIVAGIMSGTSADGINVALVRLASSQPMWSRATRPRVLDSSNLTFKFVAQAEYPYPKVVRRAVLQAMNAAQISVADLARLNFLLAELYAEAVLTTQHRFRLKVELIGCHGQTLYHQGEPANFLGRKLAVTWQTGEGAVIAARTGVPVVSDFRPADMAAGGKGAPLVPFLDYLLYRDRQIGRIVQNIGGIANLTAIPAGASAKQVIAFDTGPGNMVIDALVSHMTEGRQTYDRDGRIARRAKVHDRMLVSMLADPYFGLRPPKTTGREQFGQQFANSLVATGIPLENLIATATECTARSVASAIATCADDAREVIASGGGVHNHWLMRRLRELLPDLSVSTSADFGIDPDAKEAIAFALLAHEFVMNRPGNLPSATGARRAVLLGRSTPVY